jgi:hypothetical protein
LTINGTATDNTEIQTLELIIDMDTPNGIDITHLLADGNYSYDMSTYALGYGEHTITIRATDTSENIAENTRNIRVAEGVAPDVRIDSPDEGQLFRRGDIVVISGKATDNTEIGSLELSIDNGEPIDILSTLDEDGYWTYDWDTKSTSSGPHSVTIMASDVSGNIDSDDVNFILDGSAPVAYIQVPNDDQLFKAGNTIVLEGTASDDLDLESVYLVFDDGSPVDITRKVKDGEWRYNWESFGLDSGPHTISVRAEDHVGHMIENGISIMIDAEDPDVTITGIGDIIEIGDWITVRGTANDDIEIAELVLVIDDEKTVDITSSLSYGAWMWDMDTSKMNEGIHIITVIARDGVDNEIEEFILIELAEEGASSDGETGDSSFEPDVQVDKDSSDEMDTEAYLLLFILFILIALGVVAIFSVRAVKRK